MASKTLKKTDVRVERDGTLLGIVTKIADKKWQAEHESDGNLGVFKTRTQAIQTIEDRGEPVETVDETPDETVEETVADAEQDVEPPVADADEADEDPAADASDDDEGAVVDATEATEDTETTETATPIKPEDVAPMVLYRFSAKVYKAAIDNLDEDGFIEVSETAHQIRESMTAVEGAIKDLEERGLVVEWAVGGWTINANDGSDGWQKRAKVAVKAMRAPSARRQRKPRERDHRLPAPGTVVQGKYKGETYEATVHKDDVEYDGQRFRTLSRVGQIITGSACNGYRFFGLTG